MDPHTKSASIVATKNVPTIMHITPTTVSLVRPEKKSQNPTDKSTTPIKMLDTLFIAKTLCVM